MRIKENLSQGREGKKKTQHLKDKYKKHHRMHKNLVVEKEAGQAELPSQELRNMSYLRSRDC